MGLPTGRESYGNGVTIVVVGVTPHLWKTGEPFTGRSVTGNWM
ncbi:hypothetical protein [Dendronalium sp. ChiSLP03b]